MPSAEDNQTLKEIRALEARLQKAVAKYEDARLQYCDKLAARAAFLKDEATGKELQSSEQRVFLRMQLALPEPEEAGGEVGGETFAGPSFTGAPPAPTERQRDTYSERASDTQQSTQTRR